CAEQDVRNRRPQPSRPPSVLDQLRKVWPEKFGPNGLPPDSKGDGKGNPRLTMDDSVPKKGNDLTSKLSYDSTKTKGPYNSSDPKGDTRPRKTIGYDENAPKSPADNSVLGKLKSVGFDPFA